MTRRRFMREFVRCGICDALAITSLCGFGAGGIQTLQRMIQDLGLAANSQFCLDAGAGESYTSGQSWLDLSGNGQDFFLGADGSSGADDPTFNGTVGALNAEDYFSVDGGDDFTYDSANETWMTNCHKDTASFSFFFVFFDPTGTTGTKLGLAGTVGNEAAGTGFEITYSNTSRTCQLLVRNAGAAVLTSSASGALTADAWNTIGLSVGESSGIGGDWVINGGSATNFDPTYSSPATSAATNVLQLLASGGGNDKMASGARLACVAAWSSKLSVASLQALHNAIKGRFGI